LSERPILPGWERGPFATGRTRYFDDPIKGVASSPRIFLEVWPGAFPAPVLAMVDTAAPWCIFDAEIGEVIRKSFELVSGRVILSTRLGTFGGALYSGRVAFELLEGEALDLEVTVFLSPDWQGGNFLGYEGFLQRIRFAVDPESNLFYFGRI
jgi:hypothetical protein